MLGCERDDQIAMNHRQRTPCHDQPATVGSGYVDSLARPGGYVRVTNDCRSRHFWRDLFEQFQPFSADAVFEQKETGGVADQSAWR